MGQHLYSLSPLALCSFFTVSFILLFSSWGLALNPRSRTNQSFCAMCLAAIVWNLGFGFMLCSRDPVMAERWYRFSYLGVVFISPGVFFFTSTITRQLERNRVAILIAYALDLAPDLPPVLADRDRMLQVVTNILVNAVKFSRKGGEIRIRAEAFEGRRWEESSPWIKVSLSDQGIGIEEKDFDVIFDKFRQVSGDTTKDKPEGTGLGLHICKDIILHYGGISGWRARRGKGAPSVLPFRRQPPMRSLKTRNRREANSPNRIEPCKPSIPKSDSIPERRARPICIDLSARNRSTQKGEPVLRRP